MKKLPLIAVIATTLFAGCKDDDNDDNLVTPVTPTPLESALALDSAEVKFAGSIDFDNLDNYEGQNIPDYINKDNTANNGISNKGATLGRVLFYDKELSIDRSLSCASCHQQQFAFSDTSLRSKGVNGGLTGRHSMRLINSRFADETQFFWDERASTLEEQTTMPIQDHAEMGFSGQNGNPDLNDLLVRMRALQYYKELFNWVYEDTTINENRIQLALAQFVRSIQSFDSKFDQGFAAVNGNLNANFNNYTAEENQGKQLFVSPSMLGGAGCQACHRAPEFDISPNSGNNGVITSITAANDINNTRAPSLRDLFDSNGVLNGPLMHDGSMANLAAVIDHYNQITIDPANTNLDNRLRGRPGGPGGPPATGQNLSLSQTEKDALVAFIKTLSGSNVYTDTKWSDPF